MKRTSIILLFCLVTGFAFGQKYMTQSGTISFVSEAPIENITSTNNQVSSVIDMENGNMAFTLLMNAFVFEKALMQEHFNEKYVESPKYPKSSFKGKIDNFDNVTIGTEPVEVVIKGTLTIHGVSNEIEALGYLHFNADKNLVGLSEFTILLADYKIKIPGAVTDNISKEILINIEMEYEKLD